MWILIALSILFLLIYLIGVACYLLWKKGKFWRLVSISIVIFLSLETYWAFFPMDSFYKEEFERVSELNFPESGKIIYKYATYPDIHGDYISCALIEISADDYKFLKERLLANSKSERGKSPGTCGFDKPWGDKETFYELSLERPFERDESWEWGIIENPPQVYFNYWSS